MNLLPRLTHLIAPFAPLLLKSGLALALLVPAVLILACPVAAQTIGYWRFEGDATGTVADQQMPGNYLSDSGPNGLNLTFSGTEPPAIASPFPNPVPQNGLANVQAANFGTSQGGHFNSADAPAFGVADFTIEAFVNLAEDDTSDILYIASQFDTGSNERSWALGMGGGGGGRDQGELLLLLSENGSSTSVILSDLSTLIEVGKDYYVAASYDETVDDDVTFFIQNLTDGGDLMSTVVSHGIVDLHDSDDLFQIGTYDGSGSRRWQGVIDEVRLSGAALTQDQLLVTAQQVPEPSSLAMFALIGIVSLGAFAVGRRKRPCKGV